jgi:GMP synthase (glutamine-hydrolysing)
MDSIAILDFGSQYAQLIARRVREAQVYCELYAWDAPQELILAKKPRGFILSGGPASVYEPGAPFIQKFILSSGLPILGICYGMQAMTHALGGQVDPSTKREYGSAELDLLAEEKILTNLSRVWMSHGDRITRLPEGFSVLAKSTNSPIAAMADLTRKYYAVQFHPEVQHTPGGGHVLAHFVTEICGAKPEWTPKSITDTAISQIRDRVGGDRVLAAVSGGVDSTVAAALAHKAIGDRLAAVFVDTGLLRRGEARQVALAFRSQMGIELLSVDAGSQFLAGLRGVTDPESKRKIVGELFIRVFESQASKMSNPRFLLQGTVYPDVIESSAPDRNKAERIKSHHNVGGLPEDMNFELVEPLRYLFKDEVRLVGEHLGLPASIIWRQPFPGPGLTVRCIGEVTHERLERLRGADDIYLDELTSAGYLGEDGKVAQAFAILLPVRSVGVMGDQRTYQEVVVLRAVTSEDFMTADWTHLPQELLARISSRIVNEVDGINRVVYDITSKPPATIEWE